MRNVWALLAGVFFAGYVMLWSVPLVVVAALVVGWAGPINLFHAFSGESVFGVRNIDGRMQARLVNVNFITALVAAPGQMRPRRLLLRLEVVNADVFAGTEGQGRVRLDAWALEDERSVLAPPLYTVIAPGRNGRLEDEALLMVEIGQRHSAYSLSDGSWLYDADGPVAGFSQGQSRRMVAAAAADDEMPPGSVAVVSYASAQKVLKRVLISASDATRARLLRTSISLIRPLVRNDEMGRRWLDLTLPAGIIRIPFLDDSLDLAHAVVPPGLAVGEISPWGKRS